MLYLADPDLTVRQGDVLAELAELEDESVDCVVTSPPYWGLRDYGTASWQGGEADCDHLAPMPGGTGASGLANYENGLTPETTGAKVEQRREQYRDVCGRCGALRQDEQLGLEATPELYIAKMVEVFQAVRRVLKKEGTLWLNMGDSYASGDRGWYDDGEGKGRGHRRRPRSVGGLKPKDLVGMPWELALALRRDGWWLRSDVIWGKPNPMPESVVDRPTKAHEYVFLLTKSGAPLFWTHEDGRRVEVKPKPDYLYVHRETGEERREAPEQAKRAWRRINLWEGHDYYWDREASREPFSENTHSRSGGRQRAAERGDDRYVDGDFKTYGDDGKVGRFQGASGADVPKGTTKAHGVKMGQGIKANESMVEAIWGQEGQAPSRRPQEETLDGLEAGEEDPNWCRPDGWASGPGSHSAVEHSRRETKQETLGDLPPEAERGADGRRKTTRVENHDGLQAHENYDNAYGRERWPNPSGRNMRDVWTIPLQGYSEAHFATFPEELVRRCILAGCPIDGTVLDPFGGSGTVAVVARRHGRRSILVELNPEYCEMIVARTHQLSLLAEGEG